MKTVSRCCLRTRNHQPNVRLSKNIRKPLERAVLSSNCLMGTDTRLARVPKPIVSEVTRPSGIETIKEYPADRSGGFRLRPIYTRPRGGASLTCVLDTPRVSTGEHKLDIQLDALEAANCEMTYTKYDLGPGIQPPGSRYMPGAPPRG